MDVPDIFSEAELHALCRSHAGLTTLLLQLVYQKCHRTLQDSAGWRGILPFESYVHTACVFRRCRSYRVYLNLFDKYFIEGSLEVKPPTIWTDGKADVGRAREEKGIRKKIREERVRRKKMQVREKVEKSQNTVLGSKRLGCLVRYYWYRYKNFRFCFNPCFGHHFFFWNRSGCCMPGWCWLPRWAPWHPPSVHLTKVLEAVAKEQKSARFAKARPPERIRTDHMIWLRSRRTRYQQMFIHYDTILQQGKRIPCFPFSFAFFCCSSTSFDRFFARECSPFSLHAPPIGYGSASVQI